MIHLCVEYEKPGYEWASPPQCISWIVSYKCQTLEKLTVFDKKHVILNNFSVIYLFFGEPHLEIRALPT